MLCCYKMIFIFGGILMPEYNVYLQLIYMLFNLNYIAAQSIRFLKGYPQGWILWKRLAASCPQVLLVGCPEQFPHNCSVS